MKPSPSLDPRTYLLMTLLLSLFAVLFQHVLALLVVFLIALLCAAFSKAPLRTLARRLRGLIAVIVFVALAQSLFAPAGQTLVHVGTVRVLTTGGLLGGLVVLLRFATLILGGAILANCGSNKLILALVRLKMPYELAYMVSIGIRFVPLFGQELRDAVLSLELRGVDFKKIKLGSKVKILTYLFMPAVAGAVSKAQDLAIVMEARGFRACPGRTSYLQLELHRRDVLTMVLSLALAALLLCAYLLAFVF